MHHRLNAEALRGLLARITISAIVVSAALAWFVRPCGAEPEDEFQRFYEEYPQYQDFFPFGVYGGGLSPRAADYRDCSPAVSAEMLCDLYSDYSINFLWRGEIGDDAFNRRIFGRELPNQGIRIAPNIGHWVGRRHPPGGPFQKYMDRKEVLNERELAVYEKEFGTDRLKRLAKLASDYPESIVGYVIGDEPHIVPPIVAAAQTVEKYTKVPGLIVENSPHTVGIFAPYLPLMAADWYRVSAWLRNSWSIAADLRKFHCKHPGTNLWLMPMTHVFVGNFPEMSKPGLRDWQLTREELRLHFWSGLALGVKGFVPYKALSEPFGLRSCKALVDPLLRPEEPERLLEEMGELGRDATTIGPLLLSCRPDNSFKIEVDCPGVSFAAFEGPAIDHGLLKDVAHDRYYLIPWNNDIDRNRSATIRLPAPLLAGRHVYDMRTLTRLDGAETGELRVELPPGGGAIYLLANAQEFAGAERTVHRHRAERARIAAWKRLRIAKAQGLDVAAAEQRMRHGAAAAAQGDWRLATNHCREVPPAVDRAEDRFTPAGASDPGGIKEVRAALEGVADELSNTNMLVNTHASLLEIDLSKRFDETASPNRYAGPALDEWKELVRRYYRLQERFRTGRFWDATSDADGPAELLALTSQSRANAQAVKRAIEKRLAETRKNICVALVTADRRDQQACLLYSFAYDNCHVRWFVPGDDGVLRDRNSKPLDLDRFDVVWYHQDRFLEPYQADSPEDVLLPELTDAPMLAKMGRFISESGGGLLLTGIAGLYTLPLGIEKAPADHVRQNTPMHGAYEFQLAPAPGFAEHPIFAGFAADAMPANAVYGWIPQSVICEYAWEQTQSAGLVLARQTDNGPDAAGRRKLTGFDVEAKRFRGDAYAPVVEYRPGKGKALVLGGLSVHMMPGGWDGRPRSSVAHRRRIRKFTLNALEYLASPRRFEASEEEKEGHH